MQLYPALSANSLGPLLAHQRNCRAQRITIGPLAWRFAIGILLILCYIERHPNIDSSGGPMVARFHVLSGMRFVHTICKQQSYCSSCASTQSNLSYCWLPHEILALIASTSSVCTEMPAHKRIIARGFASRIQKTWM